MAVRRQWAVHDLPEGRSGRWTVQRYVVGLSDQISLPELLAGTRPVIPGVYTRLLADNSETWMSDTPSEFHDHDSVLDATGRILINGLGLGILPNWLLQDPAVTHVDIVEIDPDIVQLVAPWLVQKWGGRVTVHLGDAFRYVWPRGTQFDYAWHDIWVRIDWRNLPEMEDLLWLHQSVAAEQDCWGLTEIREQLKLPPLI